MERATYELEPDIELGLYLLAVAHVKFRVRIELFLSFLRICAMNQLSSSHQEKDGNEGWYTYMQNSYPWVQLYPEHNRW